MLMISIADIPKSEQHRHAHNLLRECLKTRGISYETDCGLGTVANGKPYLTEYPDVHFNLSHSDGIAACMIAKNDCGIDCERVREYRPNVLRRAFTDAERAAIESAPEGERDLLFFRLWTLKESYIKATGAGLSCPMSSAEFSIGGGVIRTNIKGFRFRQLVLKNGRFVVSICTAIGNNTQKDVCDL